MADLHIRPFEDGDLPTVERLWRDCGLVVPWNDPATDIAFCRRSANAELFVGLIDGDIRATAMTGHDGHRGWVYYVAVAPESRHKGLGRRMVSHAEAWLRNAGAPKVQLMIRPDNTAVRDFYARLGYTEKPRLYMERWFEGGPGD